MCLRMMSKNEWKGLSFDRPFVNSLFTLWSSVILTHFLLSISCLLDCVDAWRLELFFWILDKQIRDVMSKKQSKEPYKMEYPVVWTLEYIKIKLMSK